MIDNARIASPVSDLPEASQARLDARATVSASERFSWLEGSEPQLQNTPLGREWLELVCGSQGSSVYVHPAVALTLAEGTTPPQLCAQYTETPTGSPMLARLAFLTVKTQQARLVSSLPVGMTLVGRRVLGSHIYGSNAEAAADTFIGELARFLLSGRSASDFVLFEDVEVGTSLWRALAQAEGQDEAVLYYPTPPQPHWWIDFPANPSTFWENLSSKSRSTLRRRVKKLPHTLHCYQKPDEVQPFLEKASDISRRSWQAKRLGLRMRNDQRQAKLLGVLAAHGALRSYILESDGKPVAFEFGTQWQGTYFAEETGYDQALAAHSPGIVLLGRFLEDLVTHDPPQHMDFGPGDSAYKRLVSNRQTLSGPVLLLRRSLRPRLALAIFRARSGVSGLVRTGLRRLGLLAFFRAQYRK